MDDDAADAIFKAKREEAELVAMGVSRRAGDQLSFETVADALLKEAPCSLIFIAPRARGGEVGTQRAGAGGGRIADHPAPPAIFSLPKSSVMGTSRK